MIEVIRTICPKKDIMNNLQELIQNLDTEIKEKEIDNALDLLNPFEAYNGEDWKKHIETQKKQFQYAVLHQDDNFKLVLIYWYMADKSSKHGHMNGGGLMRVLAGKLQETRFWPDDQEKAFGTFTYQQGDLSYIHDALALHVVENPAPIPAVSLHLYCTGVHSTFGLLDGIELSRNN